ncbi:cell division protein FtsW [Parelusimicrobium proximum]|uniref:FtsW/RodA/SpoVE family cell cycle protein n=1 Tax=Parelusimicrobium proximum TaxID=3228953 RepID=UPI003D17850E
MKSLFLKKKTNIKTLKKGAASLNASKPKKRVNKNSGDIEFDFLPIDKSLAFITLSFIIFGLVFTYSSSAFDSSAYFKRQLLFDIAGLTGALFLSQFYTKIQKKISPLYIMCAAWILLIIVLFCKPVANVHRWINLGFFNLQPSELAKPAIIIYIAWYLDNISVNISKSFAAIVPPLVVSGFTFFLMMLAPDLGTPFLMFSVVFLMLAVGGAKIRHLALIMLAAIPVLIHQLIFYTYRLERLFSFLRPEATEATTGYQLMQSFMAIGSGGWLGKGLGNSELKLQYLPAAHTDFIFSIISEEIGLIGVLVLIAVFVWFLVKGVKMALNAKSTFNSMLMLGITLTICLQAFFNMSVAIGLLPTKGLPLPFFSYGGSSVLVTLSMMGILANLAAVEKRNNPTVNKKGVLK